jgi:hypothetical protein
VVLRRAVGFSGFATPVTEETLDLGKPLQFQAMAYGFGSNDTVALEHIAVNAGSLSNRSWGDDLKLFAGNHMVADLRLGAHYDPGQFDVERVGGASLIHFDGADTSHQIVMAGQPLHHF